SATVRPFFSAASVWPGTLAGRLAHPRITGPRAMYTDLGAQGENRRHLWGCSAVAAPVYCGKQSSHSSTRRARSATSGGSSTFVWELVTFGRECCIGTSQMAVPGAISTPQVWLALAAGHSAGQARCKRDYGGGATGPGARRGRSRAAARAHLAGSRER